MTMPQLSRGRKFDLVLLLAVVLLVGGAGLWLRRQASQNYRDDSSDGASTSTSQGKAVTVEDWISDLASSNLTTRFRAVDLLAAAGPSAVPSLGKALTHENPSVRKHAAMALRKIGPDAAEAVPALVERLKDEDRPVIEESLVALKHIGPSAESAVPAIAEMLDYPNAALRSVAIEALAGIGQAAVPSLTGRLHHPDLECRLNIAIELSSLEPSQEVAQVLCEGFTEQDQERSKRIMGSFPRLGRIAVPVLLEALSSEDKQIRARAAGALGGIGPEAKDAVPALIKALKDDYYQVRWGAASALGSMGQEAECAIPDLIEALNGPDGHVPARAIVKIGPENETVLDALINALKSENLTVRRYAADGLEHLGPRAQRALPALRDAAQADDNYLKFQVAQALWKVGQDVDGALPLLIDFLDDPRFSGSPSLITEASVTLGEMGDQAKAAVPALTRLIRDRRRFPVEPLEARGALKKIDPAAAADLGIR